MKPSRRNVNAGYDAMRKLIGATVRETLNAFRGPTEEDMATERPVLGGKRRPRSKRDPDALRAAWTRVILSLVLLAIAVYLMVVNIGDSQKVAATLFGVIGGYWLS